MALPLPPAAALPAASTGRLASPGGVNAGVIAALLAGLLLLIVCLAAARPANAGSPVAPEPAMELLRLRVPAAQQQAWLAAEEESWGPWLARQEGFQGRELYWDPQRQEGVVLIRWASRDRWKAIPAQEVAAVQRRFEQLARSHLQQAGLAAATAAADPFPLVAEGELQQLDDGTGHP